MNRLFTYAVAFSSLLLASCATQNVRTQAVPRTLLPIVTAQGNVAPDAAEALLDSSLGNRADNASVRGLINDVRRNATSPLAADNRVTLLIDGPQTFGAMRTAIEAARRTLHLETYIFSHDELGDSISELLIRKHREGVEVRVIYDAIGSIDTPDSFFDHLREGGVEVREFRPLNPVKTPFLWKINNRDHRKILIVDGAVGFTGGMNISATYESASSSRPGPTKGVDEGWRDTQVRIEGPAVAQLQKLFLDIWNRAADDEQPTQCDEACYPPPKHAGEQLVTIVANDGDSAKDRSLYATYMSAFAHASRRIWITQAYFAPNEALLAALSKAVKRGVDVRLIVPGFTDSGLILHASRHSFGRLLKSGVHIYERRDALLHAKTAVIDGVLSVVGSANLDMRSFVHNNEVNAIVISRDFGRQMEQMFERDETAARALNIHSWRRRSMLEKMKEFGASLLGYWL